MNSDTAKIITDFHDTIIDGIVNSRDELYIKFCQDMIESFPVKGIAIAERKGEDFIVCCNCGLFPAASGVNIIYSADNGFSLSASETNQDDNKFLYIPNADQSILLIIDPIEKSTANISEIQAAAGLLTRSAAFLKKQAQHLNKYTNYLTVFQKSSNLTAILNMRGDVVEWNEAAQQLYGRDLNNGPVNYIDFISEDEIPRVRNIFSGIYRKCVDYRKTLDQDRVKKDLSYREIAREKLMQMGSFQGLTQLTNRSGSNSLDVEYTISMIFDSETLEQYGAIVTTTDITKRKVMREQLEETERKYRELFKLIPLFSMLIDTSGETVDFNYISIDDYGLEPGLEGISYMDFIHQDDRKRAAALLIELYTRAIEIKNRWVMDKRITKDECARQLRSLRIKNEQLRMVSRLRDRVFETEFNVSLWISESDLEIKGSLLSAFDRTELNNYRRKLEDSEKKYRELVEKKTRDIIFSLDDNARFVMVNSNIREKLGYDEETVIGKNIIDILYKDPADKIQINRETFLENLSRVLKEGLPDVRFKAVCDHKFLGEPVTLQFKLDPILENDTIVGIMGFASEISDDPLREYLEEETLSYAIENRLTIAEEVSFRVTRNLQKYLSYSKATLVRLGIREMIVNAIEHGNLGITYEEKSLAQKSQSYQDLLRDRQMSAENKPKKVYVEYRLQKDKILYSIRDEGSGFNYKKYLAMDPVKINKEMLQHGRGILITRSVFDTMKYNETGNVVNLAINLKKKKEGNP
jgi:PAS domain S-box-containing protein